ncbi:hypothetical protein DB30_00930 [Enhygromyxa salina]|uniref:Uncharacterized protein n=1 Tax=Enhygromyxa salina TaxID=215803 RepID=A0A0C1ZPC2_9BACT|nr:hypothetical protein [Enhygromyxa salina]KIG12863.1 hypothetical protein DB30_00930 [Enhygromyxa salina]
MNQITMTEWLALLDSIKADIASNWQRVEVDTRVARLDVRFGQWTIQVYIDEGRPWSILHGLGWPKLIDDIDSYIHGRIDRVRVSPPTEPEVELLREREPNPLTADELEALLRGIR